ncbi:hypothetical protein, partial [Silvibacterium dinghuense]|uniref:hypothetical protein n=1 Tax=Silvibacterium dinghuense TaxID=1560006 RepID=UPI00195F22D9
MTCSTSFLSKRNSEICLALSRRISLAGTASSASVRFYVAEVRGPIGDCGVWSADLHAIQDIEELHAQLHVDL